MTQPEPPVTVLDLTDRYIGWEVHVDDPEMTNSVRKVWVLGVAQTELQGELLIEIRDGLSRWPNGVTLLRYPPDTPCRVSRLLPKPHRTKRRPR